MPIAALLVIALALPTGTTAAYVAARRLWAAYQRSRPPLPTTLPIERLRADLRRLRDEYERLETATDLPAKHQRCVAIRAAYVDALTEACRQLQIAVPRGHPVSRAEIYRVEAALRREGLDVRLSA